MMMIQWKAELILPEKSRLHNRRGVSESATANSSGEAFGRRRLDLDCLGASLPLSLGSTKDEIHLVS